ncbi:MAG: dnaB, partial [Actinomycetia bacterium]|nr:dnaB [Actinomycetes bacterium]
MTEALPDLDHVGAALDAFATRLRSLAGEPSTLVGLASGLPDLDQLLGGFRPGTLTVIAGRQGMGAMSLVLGAARHVALHFNRPVLYARGAADREQLARALIAAHGRIAFGRLWRGRLNPDDWARVEDARSDLAAAPIWIYSPPLLTISGLV